MSVIEEIPLEPQESLENDEEMQPTNQENSEVIQPAPKKRGRPAGAKNKPKPPAAKAKAKAKVKAAPQYDSETEEDETPPPRPQRRREQPALAPQELDRHALASEVLGILQQQRYQWTSARRSHYASWFENMS